MVLINKFKNVLRSDLAKVSLWSGIVTLLRMLINLAISKILAVFVGPSGFAMIGQLQNGLAIFSTVSSGAIGTGVTKYIAEDQKNVSKKGSVIHSAIKITLVSTTITTFCVLIFSKIISFYLFNTDKYQSIVIFFAIGLSFNAFNGLMLAIINGEKRFRIFIIASLAGTVFIFLLTFGLVYFFNLYGALMAFAVGQSFVFFVTLFLVRDSINDWKNLLFHASDESDIYFNLFNYSLMALTSSLVVPFSQILIRNKIVHNLSATDAGIWDGINKVSTTFLGIITISLTTYFLPRISEISDSFVMRKEIIKTISIILPLVVFTSICIYLSREIIIHLLFTPEFLPMKDLFSVQVFGDSIKILSWIFSFILLAKAKVKTFIVSEILFSFFSVVLSFFMIDKYGLIGTTYAYVLNYIIYLCVMLWATKEFFEIHLN